MTPRTLLALILAGIAGLVAKDLISTLLIDPGLTGFAGSPLAHLLEVFRPDLARTLPLAISIALVIPVCLQSLRGRPATWIAMGAVMILGAVLAKLVFGVGAPWFLVLVVYAGFALAAVPVFRVVAKA